MTAEKIYEGRCFCGTIEFTSNGEPAVQGYCHCESCRHWSAGPVNAFTLWPRESVVIVKGADAIGTYRKTDRSHRNWCKNCGGHVFTDHPGMGLIDVYAAIIPNFPFRPTLHVQYGEGVLRVRDGLPKFKDFPKEFDGSGVTLPE